MQKITAKPLQHLIQSLSVGEKSSIKAALKTGSDRKRVRALNLFELLEKKRSYSPDVLCTKTGIKSKTTFSTIKKYLQEYVLDRLVSRHRRTNIDSRLHFFQRYIAILFEKGLFVAAEKMSTKATDLATQYAKFQMIATLLHLKNSAMQYRNYKEYKTGSDDLFNQIQLALQHQKALDKIRLLYQKVKVLGYRTWLPIGAKEMEDIQQMQYKLDEMERNELLMRSVNEEPLVKLYYLNTRMLCYYMLHEKDLCTSATLQVLDCWNASKHLINEYAELFIHSVNTTCYNNFYCRNITRTQEHIDGYVALSNKYLTSDFYSKIFSIICFNTKLKIYHKTAQYDLVRKILNQQGARILSYNEETLPPPDALSVPTSIYISYFVLERWEEAETQLLAVKEQNRTVEREDILFFTLMFYLLILYEKKEWYRLDSAIEAAYHFLYARKKLRVFERELLLFMKRLITARNQDAVKAVSEGFLEKLHQIQGRDIPLYSLYFDFTGWVASKIKGLRYMDYVLTEFASSAGENKDH